MTAALTWSIRLDERRDARSASARSQAQHPPAGTRAFFGRIRSAISKLNPNRVFSPINSRDSAGRSSSYAFDRRRAALSPFVVAVVVVVLPRDDVEPAWTSRRRGWGLPLGVAARNDPAGDTSARRACAMTLLRSPRIKREPVTRRPLLFSSLCYPSISLCLSRRAAPRPPGGWPLRDRGCTEARTHPRRVRLVVDSVAASVFARIMMLSLLTDRRTLYVLDVGYYRFS